MSRVSQVFGSLAATLVLYHALLRPKVLRRGATEGEAKRSLPGDEIAPATPFRSTMATTLRARPEEVWPWLLQVGWDRGAFYSYNWIEGLMGMDLHNADHIHPEWQDLGIGDTMWMSHPRLKTLFPQTRVAVIEPYRTLVFAIYGPGGAGSFDAPSGAWTFALEPIDAESTRLIARLQVAAPTLLGKAIFYGFMEPAHFVMQQGMFKGLQERLARAKPPRVAA